MIVCWTLYVPQAGIRIRFSFCILTKCNLRALIYPLITHHLQRWSNLFGFCPNVHTMAVTFTTLQWRHNGCDGVSNHRRLNRLLKGLMRLRISKKTSKLQVTGLCGVNIPVNGEFPTQGDSDEKSVSIWWRHHESCQWKCHSHHGQWITEPYNHIYTTIIFATVRHCLLNNTPWNSKWQQTKYKFLCHGLIFICSCTILVLSRESWWCMYLLLIEMSTIVELRCYILWYVLFGTANIRNSTFIRNNCIWNVLGLWIFL